MNKILSDALKTQRENIKAALIENAIEATLDSDFNTLDMAALAEQGAALTGKHVTEQLDRSSLEGLFADLLDHLDEHMSNEIEDGMPLSEASSKKELGYAMDVFLNKLGTVDENGCLAGQD